MTRSANYFRETPKGDSIEALPSLDAAQTCGIIITGGVGAPIPGWNRRGSRAAPRRQHPHGCRI